VRAAGQALTAADRYLDLALVEPSVPPLLRKQVTYEAPPSPPATPASGPWIAAGRERLTAHLHAMAARAASSKSAGDARAEAAPSRVGSDNAEQAAALLPGGSCELEGTALQPRSLPLLREAAPSGLEGTARFCGGDG